MAVSTIDNNGVNLGQLGNRNMIINGGMQVDQRNGGAAVTVGSSNTFVADRIVSRNSTATGTITGQQSTLGNSKSAKLTATAAVTDLTAVAFVHGLFTLPEAQDVYHLNGQTVTLSFVVETNWTGNLPVNIRSHDDARSYVVDAAVVSGINNVSVSLTLEAATVDAIDNGKGLTITIGFNNEATYQTATTGAWVAGNKLTSTSSTQWAKTTGNFINITNLQLEAGDTATPFEHRSYGDELARCQRYFNNLTYGVSNSALFVGAYYNTISLYGNISLPTTMRVSPSLTYSALADFKALSNGGSQPPTLIVVSAHGTERPEIQFNTSARTAGHAVFTRTSNTSAWMHLDAEL